MDLSGVSIDSIGGPLTIGEKKDSIGERENSIDEKKNSIGDKKDSLGERENFIGEVEDSIGERENSIVDKKNSLGERESFIGERENSIDEKDSLGERESFIGERENSIDEKKNSLGDKKNSLGERESFIGEWENSIDVKKNSLGDKKDSPGEREKFIGDEEDFIGEEEDTLGERENSIDENISVGERESFIGEENNSLDERENSTGERENSIDENGSRGECENFIGEEEDTLGEVQDENDSLGELENFIGEEEEPQHVAGVDESVKKLTEELAYLQFEQKQLMENEMNKPSIVSLAEDWDLNPTIRRTFANFEALVAANSIVETGLKPHYLELVKRANPVSTQCPRIMERATSIRNNLIMAVLFADVRAARLQDQLMKASGLLSPEKVLQAIGILPPEPSTSSTSMANDLANAVRFRCIKMLTSALKVASLPEDCAACKPEEKAAQLEAAIYAGLNKTNKKYKKRIQSRAAQLKDVNNREVLRKYMSGAITAEQLAKMTPKEMASHKKTSNEKNSNPEAD
ncbi:uncharacterized protein LOC117588623 [Drosophila guanche]|uniref:Blast:Golgin subfamily A member 6-like protein 22 n=1 Tax=Drosophila guanche TaxID=7266 RepID=A0A3B0JXL2_DROGU|nr:uncharacterized protein LOC117588623 [Drosophila guanche]SPP86805.1 blast:Golgin subfamily A member 6-like protein 22 [Drosophila guanche]